MFIELSLYLLQSHFFSQSPAISFCIKHMMRLSWCKLITAMFWRCALDDPPCLFLTSENGFIGSECACWQSGALALDLLLNPSVWMRGSDLAHLRLGELMPYYPWAVAQLLKTPLPPVIGRHNSQGGYRDVKTEIDLRKECNPEKTWKGRKTGRTEMLSWKHQSEAQ